MEQSGRQVGDSGSNAAAGNDQLYPDQRYRGWLAGDQQDAGKLIISNYIFLHIY